MCRVVVETSSSSSTTTTIQSCRGGGQLEHDISSSSCSQKMIQIATFSRTIIISFFAFLICTLIVCYLSHKGFRRSVQFWKSVTPLIVEYKYLQYKYGKLKWNNLLTASNPNGIDTISNNTTNNDIGATNTDNDKEWNDVVAQYHKKTAPKIVKKVMELGGIYIKIGQFLSSVGSGLIDDEYVAALQPLQDGAPPRSYEEISKIITKSLQIQSLDEIFESFDPIPIGAASIAQAHRARLKHKRYYSFDNNNYGNMNNRNDIENNNVKNKQSKRNYNREFQNTRVEIQDVIVKVQYPEVVDWYKADFQNLKWVTKLLNPKRSQNIDALKQRHEKELDFRLEANNLNEVSNNMIQHQLQPQYVYLPKVISDKYDNSDNNNNKNGQSSISTTTTTILDEYKEGDDERLPITTTPIIRPTQHVLVMEYIKGTSLADAMEDELNDIAYALGLSNGKELRKQLQKDLKRHFLNGGGDVNDSQNNNNDNNSSRKDKKVGDLLNKAVLSSSSSSGRGEGRKSNGRSTGATSISLLSSPIATRIMMRIIRTYASVVRHIRTMPSTIRNSIATNSDEIYPSEAKRTKMKKIDLSRVIKTLVMVHGYQVIIDGVYNADPHPGNVIIMSDGRLGLIDYGMVGRLTIEDRQRIASTVIAFATGDKDTVISNYLNSGYRAGWIYPPTANIINHNLDNEIHDDVTATATATIGSATIYDDTATTTSDTTANSNSITTTNGSTAKTTAMTPRFSLNRRYDHSKDTIYRFAKFHLDKIDLSPIAVQTTAFAGATSNSASISTNTAFVTSSNSNTTYSEQQGTTTTHEVTMWPVLKLLSKSMEYSVPDWIEQMKRIGGLLIGVASQAGRPISLSKEWYPIANQLNNNNGGGRSFRKKSKSNKKKKVKKNKITLRK